MSARAAELRSRGLDVFNLGVGEPDFEPPAFVIEAAKRAIDDGLASKYTAVSGIPALRKSVCAQVERTRGFAPSPEHVVVTVGAKHALFNLALVLFQPGDEVVIPTPYWVSYPEQVRMMGAEPVFVPSDESTGFRITPDALARAITPRTKAVVFCTPSNPSGAAYSKDEMAALLEVLRPHDCWILVDEIYAELVYDGFKHVSALTMAPDLRHRLILIDGVSKSYAMTGWRIGWLVAPVEVAKACDTVQGQSTTNPSAVAQYAALAALSGPQDEIVKARVMFQERRDVMIEGLNAIPGIRCRKPEGAFYAFADCRGLYGVVHNGKPIASDQDVAMFFLERAHVVGVPGGAFGAPGYMRLSYAAGVDRIKAALQAMRSALDAARG
jgi:aspartate aminotransferase